MALKGGSSSGIEWTDVAMMLGAIESVHECRVELTVTTRGQGHNGCMRFGARAAFAVLPGSDLPKVVEVWAEWPTTKAKTELGLIYNLVWQLDYAIQQAYEQMVITPKP